MSAAYERDPSAVGAEHRPAPRARDTAFQGARPELLPSRGVIDCPLRLKTCTGRCIENGRRQARAVWTEFQLAGGGALNGDSFLASRQVPNLGLLGYKLPNCADVAPPYTHRRGELRTVGTEGQRCPRPPTGRSGCDLVAGLSVPQPGDVGRLSLVVLFVR